jgi:Transmembrane secretion effector
MMRDWFTLHSWDEHLRQHGDRVTAHDQELLDAARALADGAPIVHHLIPPDME